MGVSGNSIAGKSFQSFTVSEELLAKVTEAVKAGEKQARTSGTIQSFEVFYRGFRQNITIGRLYIIPASVCNDRKDFPTALLYGCLVKVFGGEEVGDMIEKRIGESEFDEYSQADFDAIKEKLFGAGEGKFKSLVLFAPCWWNKREYITFQFSEDDDKLKNNLRHQVFSAYYDPRLSSAFNAIMTNVNTTKVDVTDITPKINFPFLAENLLTQFPQLQKQAGTKKRLALTRRTADAVTKEVLDPAEMDVFESLDQALSEAIMPGTETVEEAGEANEGGFNTPDTSNEVPRLAAADDKELDPKKFPKKPEEKEKAAATKVAYVEHVPGHRNSKGEAAPWVIKQHNTGKILESFKSEGAAKEGLKNMESHKHGCLEPAAHEAPITNVGPGTAAHDAQESMTKAVKENVEKKEGEPPVGIAIDETGVPRSETEMKFASSKWAGKTVKTAKVKMTFGTDKVYFDMNGNKYMLAGDAANQFLDEWLPIYQSLKIEADSKRDAIVEKLVQKYMTRMEKRPTKPVKAPKPVAEEPAMFEENTPAPMAMSQHASKKAAKKADWDSFTPNGKKMHPGNRTDADVIAAIDEHKWGNATIPINFGKRQNGVPTVKSAAAKLDDFTDGYIEAALWTEEENLNEEFGSKDWSVDRIAPETMKEIIGVCQNFQHDNAQLLAEAEQRGRSMEYLGHDFWLSRNGHGTGFWDRDELKEGGLGDKLHEAAKKYGECDLYVGDNGYIYSSESAETTPQHEMEFSASYIASKLGRIVDPESYDASSSKTKKARAEREAKLAKNRQKQADVALDIDSIWNEITEDMGPAPVVDIPGDSSEGGEGAKPEGGSSDGRPRKSDMGKLPESMTSDEPEEEKAMSDSEAESQEDSMPEPKQEKSESSEEEEKWHVSSSMEDFVKEAFEDDGGFMRRETRPEPSDEFFAETDERMKQLAEHAIETDDEMIYDVAANVGQIVDNVKHMSWFIEAVAEEIANDPELQKKLESSMQSEAMEAEPDPRAEDDLHEASVQWDGPKDEDEKKKKADAVQPDVSEAKSEVVSPDTVDADIHQETKSVPEAAKVADAVQPDVSEAKSEVVSPDTVDADIQQPTESVEEAAKVADLAVKEPEEGKCPHCGSYDTDEVDAEEGKHIYCHKCEQVSKLAKAAAAGDDLPEEVPFDFGAGDLADIVMYEEENKETVDGEGKK